MFGAASSLPLGNLMRYGGEGGGRAGGGREERGWRRVGGGGGERVEGGWGGGAMGRPEGADPSMFGAASSLPLRNWREEGRWRDKEARGVGAERRRRKLTVSRSPSGWATP
jgi:hypothetical protein